MYNVFVDRPFSWMFFAKVQDLPGKPFQVEQVGPAPPPNPLITCWAGVALDTESVPLVVARLAEWMALAVTPAVSRSHHCHSLLRVRVPASRR